MCDIRRSMEAPRCASTSGSHGPARAYRTNTAPSTVMGRPSARRVTSSSNSRPATAVATSMEVGWPGRMASSL
ncbi:Uncharacterised protein [Bordetella pertussis]|nr:Uncharacterised protein [Bordetella pertussis]CFW42174.1 Uncharacterised protein [Bordetella pertussis]